MTFTDFENITNQFESESTLIRKAEFEGKIYCLKSYKHAGDENYKKVKITKEADIMEKLDNSFSRLVSEGNNFVLCYPFVEGISLSNFLKIWDFTLSEFLNISILIATELKRLHDQNIIHLDLNPSNIIYDTIKKKISIIDFGSSKKHDSKSVYLGNPERVECDLNYISPEQTGRINRVVDLRTDLYALGAVMFEMATGKKLFVTENALELVHSHIAKIPPSIINENEDFPLIVEKIIFNLLSKNVEDRYNSDYGLIKDLENCLDQCQTKGKVDSFDIAQYDDLDKLRISQKSYGREHEIELMEKAFIRAKNGSKDLIFIEGVTGTGKSNLVAENHRLLAENNSIFIEGKFDQVNRNIPYSAWVQVFDNFFKLIITESDEVLETWKKRIHNATESNLNYLSIVIPNIKWLFNDIEEESNDYTTETQDRLKVTIKNIIKCITEVQTLVIFIDDWQWADHASIQLLKFILESNDIQNSLFIAAYRNNEINSSHQFRHIIDLFKSPNHLVNSSTINLEKLTTDNTLELLEDTFSTSSDSLKKLNELIYNRTEGNPFFYVQYLKSLASENLFQYNHETKKWEWDINNLKNSLVSDDIVSLLVSKINVLDKEEKIILQKAACIGNTVDLDLLSIICEKSDKYISKAFESSLSEGLIQQSEFIEISKSGKRRRNREIRFAHDRIQQGIYNTLSDTERSKTHYHIGLILLAEYSEKEKEKNIFILANHLNKSDTSILNDNELVELIKINYQASERAKKLVDFQNGFSYAQNGLTLLDSIKSDDDVMDLSIPLQLQRYEIASFMEFQDKLQNWEREILKSKPNKLDLIKFHKHKIRGQISQGQIEDAIDTGLQVLESHGLKINKHPSKFDIILSFIKTSRSYNKNKIHELVNLSTINDPIQKEVTEIAMVLNVACYFSNKDLWAVVMSEITRLYIKNGISPLAPLAFAGYGSILIIGSQDIKSGVAFGKLALEVQNKFNTTVALSKTLFSYYALIDWWVNPIQNAVEGLDKTMHVSKNSGDFQYYGHAATIKSIYIEEAGMHLSELKEEAIKLLGAMEHSLEKVDVYLAKQRISKISSLCNPNLLQDGLKSEYYDFELEKEVHIANKQNEIITINHLDSGMVSYYLNRHKNAYESILKEEVHGGQTAFGVFSYFVYHYLKSIIKAEVYFELDNKSQKSIKKYIKKWTKIFSKYAKFSPENFLARSHLIKASLYKIQKKDNQALEYYYKTIEIAKREGKLREEGTAWERASELQRKLGKPEIADTFIEKAFLTYKEWGAIGICERIKLDYPMLKLMKTETMSNDIHVSSKSMYALNNLDLATVLKSTEVISGEIDKEKLIKKLVLICVENAGANEGYLILKKKNSYYMSAFGDVNHNTEIFENVLASKTEALCPKVISYVERTQVSLILGDACNDPVYGQNKYISEHQIKSIFAVPIISQGDLIGIIYLINNLTRDAFTDHQKEIINLLSGQIAISLENASLVENLEEKVRERTIEIEHEKETSEKLLLNILPRSTAIELKKTGKAMPRYYNNVSVMFIDFKNFSGISQNMDYKDLVLLIDEYFRAFDDIIEKFNVEKIKTIGDAYLCVSGIPIESEDHAYQLVSSAIAIQEYINENKAEKIKTNKQYFEARIGIHTGPVVSGVVGNKKFAFDIWGDTVNIASRMESSSEIGRISISESTYQKIEQYFDCHHRGKIHAKNIGELDMYFVIGKK